MIEIKFIKEYDTNKVGDVVLTPKSSAAEFVGQGYAIYVKKEEPIKEIKEKPLKKKSIFSDRIQQAEKFMEQQPVFYDDAGLWWLWDLEEKYWRIVDDVDILNMIYEIEGLDIINSKERNEILNSLRQVGRKKIPKEAPKTWIQFKNGIIDLNNEGINIIEPTPEYFITNPIPWEIGENDETPTMDKLFEEWVGIEYRESLYEIVAYCLSPIYFIHRIFCFTGSGSNGKSKYLNLIKIFVGEKNVTSTELDCLISSRFESAKVFKKLVCLMGETNFGTLKQTSSIKRLTGQDLIGFEFKNKMPFTAENYAKIMIATNTLPVTLDKTKGFYRRWFIIGFNNEFLEGKDILEIIPKEEYNNLAKKSIKILKHLWKEGKFTNEGTIEDRKKKYEEKSDPLGMFISEECIIDINFQVPFYIFFERFITYLENRGFRKQNRHEVSMQLEEKGFEREKKNVRLSDGEYTKWTYIIGLNMKDYHETNFGGKSYG